MGLLMEINYQELKQVVENIKFESLGLKYTTVMPPSDDLNSGQGRGWQSTLSVQNKKEAEEKLKALGYSWKWLKDKSLLATSPALPAISILPDGSKSFFNQIIASYNFIIG